MRAAEQNDLVPQVLRVMGTAQKLSGLELIDRRRGAIADVTCVGPLGGVITGQAVRYRMTVRKPGDTELKTIDAVFVMRNDELSALVVNSTGGVAITLEIESAADLPAIRRAIKARFADLAAA